MRVALLIQNLDNTGGMETSTRLLAQELARAGHEVVLVTSVPSENGALAPRITRAPGKPTVVRFPWPTHWHYTLAEISFYVRAAAYLARHRYDVIQGVYASTCGSLAALLGLLARRPSVVRLAGRGPQGDMAHLLSHPLRRTLLRLIARASAVACPSADMADELKKATRGRARVRHMPNGVDEERFFPGERRAPRAVSVMRLAPGKAIPRLLDAWAIVSKERPDARLEIVGDGPELEPARARAIPGVELPGRRDDVPLRLRAASIFVLPTDAEGMSNALLEAMASGLACVATDIPANQDALGEAGVLVAPEPQAIARAVLELLAAPERTRALGDRARARVLERFSARAMTERYAALYEELVGQGA